MTDLLQVSQFDLPEGHETPPFMMEFPVSRVVGTVLVSSSTSFVCSPAKRGKVRAVPQPLNEDGLDGLYCRLVQQVVTISQKRGWGNNFSLTMTGMRKAVAYLKDQGFDEIEVLVPITFGLRPKNVVCVETPWMPDGIVVAVPTDRGFVGDAIRIDSGHGVAVVHNVVRGMAVCVGKA